MAEVTFTDQLTNDDQQLSFTTSIGAAFTIEYVAISANRPILSTVKVELDAAGGSDFDVPLHIDNFMGKSFFVWTPVAKTEIQAGSELRIIVGNNTQNVLETTADALPTEPTVFVTVGHS